ncbi:MAG: hypothetical protein QOE84_483 [Actinomycetota bacterium]|jgi:DUF4097 and DUF4098 domain-containing protein YvlB|nr:hypothetical protein [Actinomycetota bacterium]
MHQQFTVQGELGATAKLGSGSVTVEPTAAGIAWASVVALDPAHEPSVALAERSTITLQGDQLQVDVPHSGRPFRRASVAITFGLPPQSSLAVRGGAVDVRVVGGLQALAVKVGSGDVEVDAATAVAVKSGQSDLTVGTADNVAFTTGQGSLRAGQVGDAAFKAGDGSVDLGRADGAVAVRGGSVQLVIREAGPGEVDFNTGSGSASVGVRVGTTIDLDMMSGSGDVRCDLPMESSAPSGGAALRLRLRTGSGDLLVQPGQPATSAGA